MNTKTIKLDINKRLYEKITAKQGDTKSRFLLFHLLDGAVPFSLTGRTVRVYGLKPDNKEIFNDLKIVDANKGHCELELTNQALAIIGDLDLELAIYEGESKLTSIPFTVDVLKSINSTNAIESSNEYKALDEALIKTDKWNKEFEDKSGKLEELYTDRLNGLGSQLAEKAKQIDLEVERKRIDSFTRLSEGSTTGDAELIDGRVGADGVIYTNIGAAIREQTKSKLDKNNYKNIFENATYNDGYIDKNGEVNNNPIGGKCTDYIPIEGNIKIQIKKISKYGGDVYAFYNKAKTCLTTYNEKYDGNFEEITTPLDCAYCRCGTFYHIDNNYPVIITNIDSNDEKISKIDNIVEVTNNLAENTILTNNRVVKTPKDIIVNGTKTIVNNDGTVNFDYPNTSGNVWFEIQLTPDIISETNYIRARFDVELQPNNAVKIYIIGKKKTNGERNIIAVSDVINTTSTQSIDIDMAYHNVYSDFDTSKPFSVGFANYSAPCVAVYKNIAICTHTNISILGNDDKNLYKFVQVVDSELNNLKSKIDDIKPIESNSILISPNGVKYIISVKDNGELYTIPCIPNKALFIGNSLLLGHGTFGMCASNSKSDYYYYLSEYIKTRNSLATFDKLSGTTFEGATDTQTVTNWINVNLEPKKSNDYNLILVQLGDNVNTTEKIANFKNSCKQLLQYLRVAFPNSRICWIGAWYTNDEKQNIMSQACKETNCKFINIRDLNVTENQGNIGDIITADDGTQSIITSSGVASHPGNKGMKAIADRLIEKLF